VQTPQVVVDGELEYEVERILDHRTVNVRKVKKQKNTPCNTGDQYLVKWLGYGHEHNSWEPSSSLRNTQKLVDAYWAEQLRDSHPPSEMS
jgi:hypothetical protein